VDLEDSRVMTALLSLAGVGSLVVSNWSVSLSTMEYFHRSFWNALTKRQCNVTSALAASVKLTVTTKTAVNETTATTTSTNEEKEKDKHEKPSKGRKKSSVSKVDMPVVTATKNSVEMDRYFKPWIRYAHSVYGINYMTYSDSSS
jgi:hypothetical protein